MMSENQSFTCRLLVGAKKQKGTKKEGNVENCPFKPFNFCAWLVYPTATRKSPKRHEKHL